MLDKFSMTSNAVAVPGARQWPRILAFACMAAALIVAILAVGGPPLCGRSGGLGVRRHGPRRPWCRGGRRAERRRKLDNRELRFALSDWQ